MIVTAWYRGTDPFDKRSRVYTNVKNIEEVEHGGNHYLHLSVLKDGKIGTEVVISTFYEDGIEITTDYELASKLSLETRMPRSKNVLSAWRSMVMIIKRL